MKHFAIKAVPVTDSEWQPVITPIACNNFSMRPTGDVVFRTTKDDATTEDTIAAGTQEYTSFSWPFDGDRVGARFADGCTICYVKAVSGSGTVACKFLL